MLTRIFFAPASTYSDFLAETLMLSSNLQHWKDKSLGAGSSSSRVFKELHVVLSDFYPTGCCRSRRSCVHPFSRIPFLVDRTSLFVTASK